MNRIDPLPRDATPAGDHAGRRRRRLQPALTYFFLQLLPGTPGKTSRLRAVRGGRGAPAIEAVPGVASGVRTAAGGRRKLQILFDPYRAAQLGIPLTDTAARLGLGQRHQRRLRRRGSAPVHPALHRPLRAGATGRASCSSGATAGPIKLGDIADIEVRRGDQVTHQYPERQPGHLRAHRPESSANVLQTLNAVKAVVEELNAGTGAASAAWCMVQSFDASVFINRAINLVSGNLCWGILLAVGVLWWFLRRFRATLIVAVAIPVSLLATFIVLKLTGRTLNVISLAGPGLRRGHGAGRRHRGAGEHRAPARAGASTFPGLPAGSDAGLGRPARLHRHHGRHLPAGDLHARGGGPAVRETWPSPSPSRWWCRCWWRSPYCPWRPSTWLKQDHASRTTTRRLGTALTNGIMFLTSTPRKRWSLAALLISAPGAS